MTLLSQPLVPIERNASSSPRLYDRQALSADHTTPHERTGGPSFEVVLSSDMNSAAVFITSENKNPHLIKLGREI